MSVLYTRPCGIEKSTQAARNTYKLCLKYAIIIHVVFFTSMFVFLLPFSGYLHIPAVERVAGSLVGVLN
ncbi:MAG: hypothetical protein LBT62_03920, partial [Deltaproteobacteria bacterium]|nr:hypothetical protein [Deltaproteobacteria bacterium]